MPCSQNDELYIEVIVKGCVYSSRGAGGMHGWVES